MSFVGSLVGDGAEKGDSGGAGMGYKATGPTQDQLHDVWANSQSGMAQQQAFINAINGQNGLGNQSSVFNQQQALANQLQGQANGTSGPSPAQAQFQQNSNQIAAQQAGAMGSQKGMSPALQARMINQQGAGAQQQAAGQSATLGAQEQWAATQALQSQQNMMGNMANTQIGQQQSALNAYNQGANNQMTNVYGLQSGASKANSGVANTTANGQQGMFGGLMSSFGTAMGMARGGMVPGYADGGDVPTQQITMPPLNVQSSAPPDLYQAPAMSGPQSNAGQDLKAGNSPDSGSAGSGGGSGANAIYEGMSKMGGGLMGGGVQKEMSGGGGSGGGGGGGGGGMSSMLPLLAMMAQGGQIQGEAYAQQMKPIPGQAKVPRNSLQNDVVDAKLSPGEVILPLSVMNSKDPAAAAHRFVTEVLAKQRGRK